MLNSMMGCVCRLVKVFRLIQETQHIILNLLQINDPLNRTAATNLSFVGAPATLSTSYVSRAWPTIWLKKLHFVNLSFENVQNVIFHATNSSLSFYNISITGVRLKADPVINCFSCDVFMCNVTFVNNSVRGSELLNFTLSHLSIEDSNFSHNIDASQKNYGLFHFTRSTSAIRDVILRRNSIKACLFAVAADCNGTIDSVVIGR
jgi:hypothetical protein